LIYLAIALSLLFVLLLVAFNVRTDRWRNRRKGDRRKMPDRRKNSGRRVQELSDDDSELPERRVADERRTGLQTRRHKKRRAEDRMNHD